jgi:flagellar biosynthetic protein FliR
MTLDPFALSAQLFTAYLLLLGRVFGLFAAMPLFSERTVPWQAKVGLALSTAFLLLPVARDIPPLPADNYIVLTLGFVREGLLGLSIGYLARLLFGAFQFAVNLLDFQSGLSFAEVVNPGSDALSVIGQFLNTLMLLLFLELDGHHFLLRALASTVTLVPLGYGAPPLPSAQVVATLFGQLVVLGLQLALPAVLILLLIDVAFGIIGRVVPQLNVFLVALPVKIMVCLLTIGWTLPAFSTVMANMLATLGDALTTFVRMMR